MVALAVSAVLVGQPALADDGLATGGRSRYVLDPKSTTVDATVTIDLRNTSPDRGGFSYFYDGFSVPVPAGAENVRARSGGSSLPVSLKGTEDPSTKLAQISFPNLNYGGSRTITLTFEVPGEKPRAKDSTRVVLEAIEQQRDPGGVDHPLVLAGGVAQRHHRPRPAPGGDGIRGVRGQ